MTNTITEPVSDQAATYKALATVFAEQVGAETFPVAGKQPALGYTWRACSMGLPGVHQANVMDVSGRRAWDLATGYGVAPCDGSRLAILDIDDPDHESARKARQIIGKSLTVKRAAHMHIYIRLATAMHKATFGLASFSLDTLTQHEVMSLRGPGSYVVGPGSLHPSGERYEIANDSPVAELTDGQTRALFNLFEQKPQFDPEKPGHSPTSDINPRLLDAIIDALTVFNGQPLRFSESGTATLHNNPMRADDDNHSSFFSSKTGWIHDRLGDHWTITEVCNRFGINMRALGGLYGDKPQPKQLPAPAATPKPAPKLDLPDLPARRLNYWRDGIPDPLRELFLNIDNQTGLSDQAAGLVVWELWTLFVRKSLIEPHEPITVARLVGLAEDIGWNTTRWTIEKGLDQLLAWGILRDIGDDIQSDIGGRGESQNDLPKTLQNSVGRPSRKYRFRKLKAALLSIVQKVRYRIREWCMAQVPDAPQPDWFAIAGEWKAEIVRQRDIEKMQAVDQMARAKATAKYEKAAKLKEDLLNLQSLLNSPSTPLVDGEYQNTRMYRDNLYLSYVQANPGRQITRAAAAKQIGRSADALTAAGKRAGVERIPEYKYWEIYPGDVRKQIETVAAWSFDHAGSSLIAVMGDDKTNYDYGCPLDNPQFQYWTEQRFKDGFRVFLRVQVASREKVGTPQPTQPKSRSAGVSSAKSEGGKVTVWARYNPDFVALQLRMRGLQETSDGRGLIDLDAGGVILEPDNAVAA